MDHAAPEQEVHVHVGEYEEKTWVEMKEDEEDDINCLGMFDDPDPLDLFVHEFPLKKSETPGATSQASTVTITVEGFKAENGQQLNSTGLTLWRAAPILCNFLAGSAHQYVENKSVLELGAGLGLCGILAAALGASRVFMTDGDSPSLVRMRDNVHRNMSLVLAEGGESRVYCRQLLWGQRLEEFRQHCALTLPEGVEGGQRGCFDVVMGSDIIYTEDILDPLFETVDYLLRRSGGGDRGEKRDRGVFLLAYARRNVKIDDVFAAADRYGFEWTAPREAEGCFVFTRRGE